MDKPVHIFKFWQRSELSENLKNDPKFEKYAKTQQIQKSKIKRPKTKKYKLLNKTY